MCWGSDVVEWSAAFEGAPTEVLTAPRPLFAARGHEVDFFDLILADVGDDEVTGLSIEREAPGIAQAVGEDLGASAGSTAEGVVLWDVIPPVGPRIDPDQLSEQLAQILTIAVRIALPATVAEPGVEVAVGSELELTSLVIVARVAYADDRRARRGIRAVGFVGCCAVTVDPDRAALVDVIDEKRREPS